MSQLDEEFQPLYEAFVEEFHATTPRCFGDRSKRLLGVCDGNEGVQWNCWVRQDESGTTSEYLGVNLEGMKYDNWPVARLIERELERPMLLDLGTRIEHPELIEVNWTRDAWGPGGSRVPYFKEQTIPPTPIGLDKLTADGWRTALLQAQMSMATPAGGRRKQMLTMSSGQTRELPVTPHLNVHQRLTGTDNPGRLRRSLREACDNLQPIYELVRDRTRRQA